MKTYSISSDDIGFIQSELNGAEQLIESVIPDLPTGDSRTIDLHCALRSIKNAMTRITKAKTESLKAEDFHKISDNFWKPGFTIVCKNTV